MEVVYQETTKHANTKSSVEHFPGGLISTERTHSPLVHIVLSIGKQSTHACYIYRGVEHIITDDIDPFKLSALYHATMHHDRVHKVGGSAVQVCSRHRCSPVTVTKRTYGECLQDCLSAMTKRFLLPEGATITFEPKEGLGGPSWPHVLEGLKQ